MKLGNELGKIFVFLFKFLKLFFFNWGPLHARLNSHYEAWSYNPRRVGALICSMKFLSPEVALCLCESTIHPCVECCCRVWAGASSCYLDLLDELQKRICRIVGPSLAGSLEPLAHC